MINYIRIMYLQRIGRWKEFFVAICEKFHLKCLLSKERFKSIQLSFDWLFYVQGFQETRRRWQSVMRRNPICSGSVLLLFCPRHDLFGFWVTWFCGWIKIARITFQSFSLFVDFCGNILIEKVGAIGAFLSK